VSRRARSPSGAASGLCSFFYAAYTVLASGAVPGADAAVLERWLRFWYAWVSSAYVKAYLERVGEASVVPQAEADCEALLQVFLLEKCVSQLGYEVTHRPECVHIPVRGIIDLVEGV
jgi:maltose alpha-D-glucosyltransferase/alpha-amylase